MKKLKHISRAMTKYTHIRNLIKISPRVDILTQDTDICKNLDNDVLTHRRTFSILHISDEVKITININTWNIFCSWMYT